MQPSRWKRIFPLENSDKFHAETVLKLRATGPRYTQCIQTIWNRNGSTLYYRSFVFLRQKWKLILVTDSSAPGMTPVWIAERVLLTFEVEATCKATKLVIVESQYPILRRTIPTNSLCHSFLAAYATRLILNIYEEANYTLRECLLHF